MSLSLYLLFRVFFINIDLQIDTDRVCTIDKSIHNVIYIEYALYTRLLLIHQ